MEMFDKHIMTINVADELSYLEKLKLRPKLESIHFLKMFI